MTLLNCNGKHSSYDKNIFFFALLSLVHVVFIFQLRFGNEPRPPFSGCLVCSKVRTLTEQLHSFFCLNQICQVWTHPKTMFFLPFYQAMVTFTFYRFSITVYIKKKITNQNLYLKVASRILYEWNGPIQGLKSHFRMKVSLVNFMTHTVYNLNCPYLKKAILHRF